MAIVVNKAHPGATTTPDASVDFAQSLADPHYNTVGTSGIITTVGTIQATDDRGNPNTGIDFTQAGTDLSR